MLVAKHANLTFQSALELPVDIFRCVLRDAIISKMRQSEKGIERLNTWRRMNNTELDDTNIDFFSKL